MEKLSGELVKNLPSKEKEILLKYYKPMDKQLCKFSTAQLLLKACCSGISYPAESTAA